MDSATAFNRLANASARGETASQIEKKDIQVANEIVEIKDDQLEEISGGLVQCKPGQVPTNIYIRETKTWYTGCDG
jgi:hypothetical protein